LLALARARGDRLALLTAFRAVGLRNLLTGRIVEAREMTEQTVKEFSASSDGERAAARAAGQDAGAAGLAVMSWALWLLGHPDQAVDRMVAGLQRADAVKHPHTQAYVSYYASVLYALWREVAAAHSHAERCLLLSEEHGFRQWQGLARVMRGISAAGSCRSRGGRRGCPRGPHRAGVKATAGRRRLGRAGEVRERRAFGPSHCLGGCCVRRYGARWHRGNAVC